MRELPLADVFAKEKLSRDIKEARDIEKLRKAALDILDLYYSQKQATNWAYELSLSRPNEATIKDVVRDVPVQKLAPKPVRKDMDVL